MKDFFISYNRHDRVIAEWIAWALEDAGYTVVIQAWDFGAGANFVLEMQQAASVTERTIAILSETSLKSGYVQAEWASAFRQDPTGKLRSLIPIRVRPCELTGLWASINYIDLLKHPEAVSTGETEVELVNEAEAKQRILDGIAIGRRKPTQKPTFPQKSATPTAQTKPAFQQNQISPAKRQRLEQEQARLQQESSATARNVQNVSGGQGIQINDPTAPVILGGGSNTFNFNYGTVQGSQSASQASPQTILILTANPQQGTRSRLDEEVREIDQGLRLAKQREKFTLEQRWAVRPIDVRRAMLDIQPQIIHFTGQGTVADGLVFEDNAGSARSISPNAIAGLFELFADQVQCVVLNACYSEAQASAISQHIPYVIGMSEALEERAAIVFAVAFYDALGDGRTIEFAYKLACNAIQMEGVEGHLVPILKQRKLSE